MDGNSEELPDFSLGIESSRSKRKHRDESKPLRLVPDFNFGFAVDCVILKITKIKGLQFFALPASPAQMKLNNLLHMGEIPTINKNRELLSGLHKLAVSELFMVIT